MAGGLKNDQAYARSPRDASHKFYDPVFELWNDHIRRDSVDLPKMGRAMIQMHIMDARTFFLACPEVLIMRPIMVLREQQPVMVLMGPDYYKYLIETLHILSNQDYFQLLMRGLQQEREGKTKTAKQARIYLSYK